MNKTTYANFHGVVNVFLGGGCVNSDVFFCLFFFVYLNQGWASMAPVLFFHNYAASIE